MKLLTLYKETVKRLSSAKIDESAYEAGLLFEYVFSHSVSDIIINPELECEEENANELEELTEKRISGMPLQYILGKWEFMGFEFEVGKGVLIPRSETEILVEYAVNRLKNKKNPVVYDLCSGSGCIGLSIKKLLPEARVFMVEISDEAIFYLNKNRENLGLMRDACLIKGDVLKGYEAFSSLPIPDAIISNPPYVRKDEIPFLQKEVGYEPEIALDGGEDGLTFYRALSEKWLPYLNDDGFIAVECGEDQADYIADIFKAHCDKTEIIKDYSDIQRIVTGTK